MNIGLYDPYMDTLGGGEKYMLDAAVYLSGQHRVTLFWDKSRKSELAEEIMQRFGLNINPIEFSSDIFLNTTSLAEKIRKTRKFDVIIYLSDGSIPTLFAKKNILMFQHPVNWVNGNTLVTKLKLRNINTVICNSFFVKQYIDSTFNVDCSVITPPVQSLMDRRIKKEKIILSVGRFTKSMNAKKQDVLISAFKNFSKIRRGWRLILAGGMRDEDELFVGRLRQEAEGYSIEFKVNESRQELCRDYNKATIYWHAAGYNEDIQSHPEKTEHFGISTVEAMSTGCIPVVFNAGGQSEIVNDREDGCIWNSQDELIEKTMDIINNHDLQEHLRLGAIERAKDYDENVFYRKLDKLLI